MSDVCEMHTAVPSLPFPLPVPLVAAQPTSSFPGAALASSEGCRAASLAFLVNEPFPFC